MKWQLEICWAAEAIACEALPSSDLGVLHRRGSRLVIVTLASYACGQEALSSGGCFVWWWVCVRVEHCVHVSILRRVCAAWFEFSSKCVTAGRLVNGVVAAWTLVRGLQGGDAPLDGR